MKYKSQGTQFTLDTFRSSLQSLPKSNRWVQMGDSLPWQEIEKLYVSKLKNGHTGAGNKSARMVVGALIIKHKMNLSDEETIWVIQENPYMQYMLGLSEFTDKPIFDSSLFVTIRKRLQVDDLNAFTASLLAIERAKAMKKTKKEKDEEDDDPPLTDTQGRDHQGSLKVDATCSDAEVRYPTDVDLLNDASRIINRYIDLLCRKFSLAHPVTFIKQSRKSYLGLIKYKKKSKKLINGCKSQMLTYLTRDIRSFITLISVHGTQLLDGLKAYQKKIVCSILTLYHQQEQMFKERSRSCPNRIISIFQPHIRPIVRGKSKAPTEFGAKIGVSVVRGYTFIDHHSWDAYNESSDLAVQIELYRQRFGCLPHKIYADKIYMNRVNRQLMSDLEIQAMGKPLGRPPKNISVEYESQMAKAVGLRNEVEATFGTAKRIYRANNIRAKLPDTANCWTGMCYFVKNIMKFLKGLLCVLFFIRKLKDYTAAFLKRSNTEPRICDSYVLQHYVIQ